MQPNCILLCAWPCHIPIPTSFLTPFPGAGKVRIFLKDHLVHPPQLKAEATTANRRMSKISVRAFSDGAATAYLSHCPTTFAIRQLSLSLIAL